MALHELWPCLSPTREHRGDLAGGGIGAVLDEGAAQQRLDGVDGGLQCGDEVYGALGGV